ncbi:hypothetical protein [Persephonella sp.]
MAWFSLSEVLRIKPPTDERNLKRLWMRPKLSKKIIKPKTTEKKFVTSDKNKSRINIYV